MKALIIAAGKGSRFRVLTRDEPKSLVRVLGLSLIERVILTAKESGIDEFVVVVDYRGEKIRRKLGDGGKLGVKITYIQSKIRETTNGISVLEAEELLTGKFILLMADHILDGRILKKLIGCDTGSCVILAVDRRKASPGDTKVLEKRGKIVDIGKDIEEGNCIDTGISLCSPRIFSYIRESVRDGKWTRMKKGKTELEGGIKEAALRSDAEIFDITQIDSYVPGMRKDIKPFWIDIDTRQDLVKAKRLLIENACKGRNDLLATYVNKPIENFIATRLANTRITPNQVTLLTNVIAYIATFFFLEGSLLLASLLTFIVSFMDGVDGKLSRIKLASSNIGRMEHAFDFLFEHSWYIALAIYLSKLFSPSVILLPTFVVLFDSFSSHCGRVFGKAIKDRPLADYGRIEQLFRKFDGRKNSYIVFILVGVLLNRPFWSLAAIAVFSCISAVFYCSRTMKHMYLLDIKKRSKGYTKC